MTIHFRVHTQVDGILNLGVLTGKPEAFRFPGGEWHLRNLPEIPSNRGQVTFIADWRGADMDEYAQVALWADLAHRANFWHQDRQGFRFVLWAPYLPAARADKGYPLGSAVYARMINSLSAHHVVGIDPHSSVITRQISGIRSVDVVPLVFRALQGLANTAPFDGVISPDKGAVHRAGAVAQALDVPLHVCDKARDQATGAILGLKVPPLDPKLRYLVVDDICDGGGTFALLADNIGLPREQLGLWVTHGIFSGHADQLRKSYSWIGTTDSHPGHNRVGVASAIVPCFIPLYETTFGVK
jgi:ribose-phosphate pyrophosphokinase